jgi:hypothetical protein
MKGLEPLTFCMAKDPRMVPSPPLIRSDRNRQEPTEFPDFFPDSKNISTLGFPEVAGRADQLFEVLRTQHRSLVVYFGHDDAKAPGWFLHLPSGEVLRIRRFEADEPLLRVWGSDASKDVVDVVLIAPESVVISIKTLTDEDERFEIKFGSNGAGPEH